MTKPKKIVVVGGGPVGCTAALMLAKRGYDVQIYEMRPDPRSPHGKKVGKSINLTLSGRGLSSLDNIGLTDLRETICEQAVECRGRMIHGRDLKKSIILYGENNESILSVNRETLHLQLVNAVHRCPQTSLFFKHKLTGVDFEENELTFQTPVENRSADDTDKLHKDVTVKADVIFGCDGANSYMRKCMNGRSYLSYLEESVDTRYTELLMPASNDNQSPFHKFTKVKNVCVSGLLDKIKGEVTGAIYCPDIVTPKALGPIENKDEFVLIALPNYDGSFTALLFMPSHVFESLRDRQVATDFVHKHFPDAVPLIGEQVIVNRLISQQSASLMWVKGLIANSMDPDETARMRRLIWINAGRKRTRHNIGGKVLLLGDAAHAMVPFYGQGINSGFEDLSVLDELLERHNEDFALVMNEYSAKRTVDTAAMCDLSLENYNELKKKVNTPWVAFRKTIDSFLCRMFPNTWVPMYTMVAFSHIRYSECIKNRNWQNKIILRIVFAGLVALVAVVVAGWRGLHTCYFTDRDLM